MSPQAAWRLERLRFAEVYGYTARKADWLAWGLPERLGHVFEELDLNAHIEMVRVETDEEAARLDFPGSPTIHVAGRNHFPTTKDQGGTLGRGVDAGTQAVEDACRAC